MIRGKKKKKKKTPHAIEALCLVSQISFKTGGFYIWLSDKQVLIVLPFKPA